jgi:tryptophan 7-halogenase
MGGFVHTKAANAIRRIVIVGGGTAGWMTAAALAHKLAGLGLEITLIESAEIGTVGVGEATLPHIRFFNETMGIPERELMARTQATFKLGIEFVNWGRLGESYIHPFGDYGERVDDIDFHHLWTRARMNGNENRLCEYSYSVKAAQAGRFEMPDKDLSSIKSTFGYAFQFDASLYAKFLGELSQEHGVKRIEGKITGHDLNSENGHVRSVSLENGTVIEGDLFVDCSGFRGLLIEQALATGYDDWSHYLPCNRAFAVPCEIVDPLIPYTRATARAAGWQWRIPLQHRIGNGHVYCNSYITDDEARDTLMSNLEGKPLAEPRQLFFTTGRRNMQWNGNVVAIGLSAGFLEPLESTSIHLIQQGITNLVDLFPDTANMADDAAEFNAIMQLEYERVRDFLVLHYVANQRDDTPFWRDMRTMKWPSSLQEKFDAFTQRGIIPDYSIGVFLPPSWLAVFIGQNILPEGYDPRADRMSNAEIMATLDAFQKRVAAGVSDTQQHTDFIAQYCPAPALT